VGAGAGFAAFLLVKGLIDHLVRTGALKRANRDAIVDSALAEVPTMNSNNYSDTRDLLNGVKE
jgi:hypothetical protein